MDTRLTEIRLDASRLESLLESAKLLGSSLKLEDQLRHLMRTVMGRLLEWVAFTPYQNASGGTDYSYGTPSSWQRPRYFRLSANFEY